MLRFLITAFNWSLSKSFPKRKERMNEWGKKKKNEREEQQGK